jgi:hypothetical protein
MGVEESCKMQESGVRIQGAILSLLTAFGLLSRAAWPENARSGQGLLFRANSSAPIFGTDPAAIRLRAGSRELRPFSTESEAGKSQDGTMAAQKVLPETVQIPL